MALLKYSFTILLAVGVVACGSNGRDYLPPGCYKQDNIRYRAELEEQCPDEEVTHEATRKVQEIAELNNLKPFSNYDAAYYNQKYWETSDGLKYVGTVDFRLRDIYIANYVVDGIDYRTSVLRHEEFHIALYHKTGDPDYNHTDERWNNGINILDDDLYCIDGKVIY